MEPREPVTFEHAAAFTPAETSGTLGLGALESQYQELLSAVLEDGVITTEERAHLERRAEDLGLDRVRLQRLEEAMIAAYEAHHRVRIVEQYEEPVPSLVLPRTDEVAALDPPALVARIRELEGRVRELEEELRRAQAAVNVEVDLSDLERTVESEEADAQRAWRQIHRDPSAPGPYRDLYRIYGARGDGDRRWCAAQALVALGVANPEQQAVFEAHRTTGLVAPKAGVSPTAWQEQLAHPESEVVTGQIFAAIAPALLIGRVTALRREGKLHQPRPETRQDPATATITAVRAVPWAASILGLLPPALYVDPSREFGYVHVPGVPPFTLIGRQVLSGRSQLELAFHAGRHLTAYRAEYFIRTLWGAVPDLEDLFLAALAVGNPRLPIAADSRQRVAPIAAAIEPLLDPTQADLLRGLYLRFVEEGGRTNLLRWSSAAERTACRAGLLLANDLATALDILAREEGPGGPLAKDLLAFAVSERYFELRESMGIAL